jgi:hypothetical protein
VKQIGFLAACLAFITAACSSDDAQGNGVNVNTPTAPSQLESPVQGNVNVTHAQVFIKDGRVQALVQGELGDGCTSLQPIRQRRTANTIDITVTFRREGEVCTMIMQFVNEWVVLDGSFTPGEYTVRANAVVTNFRLIQGSDGELRLDPDPGPPPQPPSVPPSNPEPMPPTRPSPQPG